MSDTRQRIGLSVGTLIVAIGLFGLSSPGSLESVVRLLQQPPGLYLAAAIRLLVGVALIGSSSRSRAPRVLLAFGILVTIGGLITPWLGRQMGQAILDRWAAGGPAFVRWWSAGAAGLGGAILYAFATAPRRL